MNLDLKNKYFIGAFVLATYMLLINSHEVSAAGAQSLQSELENFAEVSFGMILVPFCTIGILIGAIKKMFLFSNPQANDTGNKLIFNSLAILAIGLMIFTVNITDPSQGLIPTITVDATFSSETSWQTYADKIVFAYSDMVNLITNNLVVMTSGLVGISIAILALRKKFSFGNPTVIQDSNSSIKKSLVAISIVFASNMLIDFVESIF